MITSCFLGVCNFTIPVYYNGVLAAYCIGGGVACEESQFSPTSMKRFHIPSLTNAQLQNIVEVLQSFLALLNFDLDRLRQINTACAEEENSFGGLLSRREQEVAKAVCCGLSNREIAKKLFISEKTVKSHVSNILLKLNLNDRVQLVLSYCNYLNKNAGDDYQTGKED